MQIPIQDHYLLLGLAQPLKRQSEIDITIDGTKSVTATFEEQIFNLVNKIMFSLERADGKLENQKLVIGEVVN